MKILFISDNFPPEVNAPATRVYGFCKKWSNMGANVTVITCAPNFPQGRVYKDFKNRVVKKENVDGIQVIRVWSYITPNKGFVRRTLDYFSFAHSSFWVGLFENADVIVATSPQFFTTWTAFALSIFKKKPWVFELRDLWPESIKAVGALNDGFIYASLEKIELYLYRHSKLIIANSPAFKENLIQRGVDERKIQVILNGVDINLFSDARRNTLLKEKLDLEKYFIVGYLGTHGLAHNLDFILRCAKSINDPEIKFLFIGDGAEKEKLKKQANIFGLQNVTFMDPVPKESAPEYLSIFDVALVPLKKSNTFKTVIPSKIFESAAMQKPILLGVEGEAKKLVENHGIGLCYEPENEKDFLTKLMILKNSMKHYQQYASRGKQFAHEFSSDELAKKMLHELATVG